jgi:hypothetical protein
MSVYTKLMQARLQLQAKDLNKSGHNKFAGYKYFELGDFLPEIQNIFAKLGLCGVVSYTGDLASLTIVDTEDNSQVIITSPMGSAALKGCHEVQNIGAVETYQRRYLWVTALEIVEHDALDSSEGVDIGALVNIACAKIQTIDSPAELKVAFGKYYKELQANKAARDQLTTIYQVQKDKLNETSGSAA